MLLHTNALRTDAFTHRGFDWHTDTFTHVYTQGCAGSSTLSGHPSSSDDRTSFRAKGLRPKFENRNITADFDDRASFRAKDCDRRLKIAVLQHFLTIEPHFVQKGCRRKFENRNFTPVFDDRTSFRAEGFCDRCLKIAILLQLLTIEPHSVRKGCDRSLKIKFYTSFWRSNLISCERVSTEIWKYIFTPVFEHRNLLCVQDFQCFFKVWGV